MDGWNEGWMEGSKLIDGDNDGRKLIEGKLDGWVLSEGELDSLGAPVGGIVVISLYRIVASFML